VDGGALGQRISVRRSRFKKKRPEEVETKQEKQMQTEGKVGKERAGFVSPRLHGNGNTAEKSPKKV